MQITGGRSVETDSIPEDENEDGVLFMDRSDCPKNGHNQHRGFIPIKEFQLSHLPKAIRTQEVVDYVKAEADMTVMYFILL